MMKQNELELLQKIARRYGIEIRQGESGQGGFIFDETGIIQQSSQVGDLFSNDPIQEQNFNRKYSIYDEIMLTAA